MSTCAFSWQREVADETVDFSCDLDEGHPGPIHLDNEFDDAYPDEDLPDPEVPDLPEEVLAPHPLDGSM